MIKTINLKNFRNHTNITLNINKNIVYINGPNGSGKTSILESIYLISTLKSHRTNSDFNLIKESSPFSMVSVATDKAKYELILSESSKVARINDKEVNKLSEFIGKLKVVMFSPEDLNIVKGSPGIRRGFIDLELMKLDYGYLTNLNAYRKIIKQRNALLKKIGFKDDLFFLNVLGRQLHDVGIKIIDSRIKFINKLNQHFKEVYKEFNNTNEVELVYMPNANKEQLERHLTKNQKIDILAKSTTAGPHRDDFKVMFDGYEAKVYASQGQIRLIAIAIKLALIKVIKSITNDEVILLLDDVLSELDETIKDKFLNNLPKDMQIIMNSAIELDIANMQVISLKGDR